MKALIPAAGLGTRMRPLTFTRPKTVLRVAGKPIIRHAIHTLSTAGISQIGIIVSDVIREELQHVLRDIQDVDITLINQHQQLGLGHAVMTGREWIGDDDFCVYLSDNLFEHGASPFIEAFRAERSEARIALVEVDNPSAFGVAELQGLQGIGQSTGQGTGNENRICRLLEKPKNPPSNLAVAGLYCFTPAIFEALEGLAPSARGEYEITDGIQKLIETDKTVLGQRVQGWWKDTGRPDDLLDANRLLLEPLQTQIAGHIEDSRLTGRVVVPASARVVRSKIVGPVFLGEDVVIEDAYIGPFTSIGQKSIVRNAEIEHSVVDAEVEICDLRRRLQDCLIGVRAKVKGGKQLPRTHKLTISDASVVELAAY